MHLWRMSCFVYKKMPKVKTRTAAAQRHHPLAVQIANAEAEERAPKVREKAKRQNNRQQKQDFVPEALTKKALALAKGQQLEETQNERRERLATHIENRKKSDFETELFFEDDEDRGDYEAEEIVIDPEDEKALALWSAPEQPRRTLADLIMEKIREKMEMEAQGEEVPVSQRLNPKVVEVYRGVGRVLAKYKSGKLPKAFKMVPTLTNWEEILYLTEPDKWRPAAVAAATRIFASNLDAKMAQRFFNLVLLPHVRNDIDVNKKLNWHLYMALKKSVFKPAAFYKGIVLPLCESRSCTLREATIVGSVIVKVSIPALQSAVALLKIAQMEYSGANSIFIRILLDKKYSLPFRVIDALVEHFSHFIKEERQLPVLWHQALLVFVQRYKEDMTLNQKAEVKQLLKHHNHHAITPEILRELNESRSRGEGPTTTANSTDMVM